MAKGSKLAVEIAPYDRCAPEIFQSVKQLIADIVSYEVEVEHVGSTGVPGLGGKGVIDILVIAGRRERLAEIAELLRGNGFSHNP